MLGFLTMGQAWRSHYLPLCSPLSRRARQQRFVLTFRANGRAEVRRMPVLAEKPHVWAGLASAAW